ncbi:POTE1-like protein, partial [Mya arenaria]
TGNTYTQLSALKCGTVVDVYGVVCFVKPTYKTRGSDYCTMISIVDQSLKGVDEKLKCLLFGSEEKLPSPDVGDIIRFHRLMVTELRMWAHKKQELQQSLCQICDVAAGCYFDLFCQAGDFVKFVNLHAPEYQPPNQPYSPTVELVLHRGNSYSRCVRVVPPDFPLLEDMKKMFDVIAIDNDNSEEDDVGETENTAEQCEPENQSNEKLDVSKAPYTKTLNGEKNEEDAVDRKLRSSDKGKRPMNPKLTNGPKTCCPNKRDAVVILPKSSANSSSVEENNFKKPTASTKVQFNVDSPSTEKDDQLKDTRSFRFKRQPLGKSKDHNDNEPDNKKRKIDTCSETRIAASQKNTQDESHVFSTANETEESLILSCEMSQAYSTQAEDLSQVSQLVNVGTESQSQCLSELESQSSDRVPPSREMSGRSIKDSGVVGKGSQRLGDMDMTDSSGFRRCILQTNTVILGHPNIARSTLRVVLDHSVPYKFCVRAQVLDYHPKPDTVTDFVHLSPHPDKDKGKGKGDNSELSVGSTFQGVPHYSCPKCLENRASLSGLESPPHLTYIYAMRLILRDDTGMVMVNIWKDDAVQFFHDVTPIQLLGKTVSFDLIKDSLAQICPQEVEPINRPWIECCLRSHSNQHGTFFQIFDTTIV